ncbi:MAG: hypothetical protein AABZ31_08435 [Bdellovibrionota bacterium]
MKTLRSQSGLVTLDYLFAFILVGGFSMLLFALSTTLATVEIVQYITYSSARNFYASHVTPKRQYDLAQKKYTELVNNPVLSPLFKNGWFTLDQRAFTIGSVTKTNPDFQRYRQDDANNLFHGTAVFLTANVLDFNVPFFGPTTRITEGGREGYGAYIGSYLGRESTFLECEEMMKTRWQAIQSLDPSYSQANARFIYVPSDNGC